MAGCVNRVAGGRRGETDRLVLAAQRISEHDVDLRPVEEDGLVSMQRSRGALHRRRTHKMHRPLD